MADAVATRVVGQTDKQLVLHLTNISDGTGESAVAKATMASYAGPAAAALVALDIERVQWACSGMDARILFDATTDDVALLLTGTGSMDFRGNDLETVPGNCCLKNPRSAGFTGNILLTTFGHSSGDSYDIYLTLRKQTV